MKNKPVIIIKNYILKNKNIPVLTFELEEMKQTSYNSEFSTYKLKKIKVLEKNLLPKNFSKNPENSKDLQKWIENRRAPKNRKNINSLINYEIQRLKLDSNNFMNFIDISYGLSLNDSYWIIPEEKKDYKWEDYNLYHNNFSEKLALIAFGEKNISSSDFNISETSPEYTTNGMLAKCWAILDGKIMLLKKSSEHYKVEAVSEYYMCQIAEIMEFEHVDYDIIKYHDSIVSACRIFTNEDEGYYPMSSFISKKDAGILNPEKLLKKISSITGDEFLENLMVFDCLIYNEDRHLGNYGMIVDNNTLEILKPAPIFDNGNSILMLYYNLPDEYDEIYAKHKTGLDFDVFAREFVKERHRKGLEKLLNFNFKRHPEYNLPEDILKKGEKFISSKAEFMLNELNKRKNN